MTLMVILAAIMAGSEVAFFSMTKREIEEYREKNKHVWDLIRFPRKLLATLLIANNLANVGIVIVFAFTIREAKEYFSWQIGPLTETLIDVGIITPVMLFFGEITPKIFASQKASFFLNTFSGLLKFLRAFFSPLIWVLVNSTALIDKRFAGKSEAASFEDIKNAIDLTSEEDSPKEEKVILKGIVNLSSIAVKSIMTSRVDVMAIASDLTLEEVIATINENNFSRIPVYEENLDSVKGILYAKDLLPLLKNRKPDQEWQSLLREPFFVPESKKIHDLLEEFQTKRLHIAVVVDEFGGTAGIVTLEDIIEEIFGEINDEFDNEEVVYSKLSGSVYVFEGKTPLQDLLKITGIDGNIFDSAKGDNDSLAGLVLELHGKIPERGEIISFENFEFHIESVSKNRINRVKFIINPKIPILEVENQPKAEV